MAEVILITGGNQGRVEEALARAEEVVGRRIGEVVAHSSLHRSKAWGFTSESDFLNQVLVVESPLQPQELIVEVLNAEREVGRNRTAEAEEKNTTGERYASRVVDIDVLFYDDMVLESPALVVPHPRLHQREFVLRPLAEVMPNKLHPVFNKTVRTLLEELDREK